MKGPRIASFQNKLPLVQAIELRRQIRTSNPKQPKTLKQSNQTATLFTTVEDLSNTKPGPG